MQVRVSWRSPSFALPQDSAGLPRGSLRGRTLGRKRRRTGRTPVGHRQVTQKQEQPRYLARQAESEYSLHDCRVHSSAQAKGELYRLGRPRVWLPHFSEFSKLKAQAQSRSLDFALFTQRKPAATGGGAGLAFAPCSYHCAAPELGTRQNRWNWCPGSALLAHTGFSLRGCCSHRGCSPCVLRGKIKV